MKTIIFFIAFVLFTISLKSQDNIDLNRKVYQITRSQEPIVIDGEKRETAWLTSNVATDFIQGFPDADKLPSQKTEVRVLYDDEAIYLFADLLDSDPDSIMSDLSLRDDEGNADWFSFSIDTYRGGLNAFSFAVTSAGVQIDGQLSDNGEDRNWDAVWESKVRRDDNGWTVEMRIPYSALRFSDAEKQEWRVLFSRTIRRHRQTSYWTRIDPAINGVVNQFGDMQGLDNIKAPIRLSINPFVVGYVNSVKDPEGDPIKDIGTAYGIGMDLKYGINDAFTLDMTLIPDFGQTQSDNQVLNLGPFEQAFEERRPFFTEGTELFNKGDLFYSRRVGGTPHKYFDEELADDESYIENPNVSQLYNAFKISGRTKKGTGIGIFNAVEAAEEAIISDESGNTRKVNTNPLTNYNVTVIDQNLKNNSFATFINTNVFRKGQDYDANVTGALINLKTKDQKWGVNGFSAISQIFEEDQTERGFAYNLELEKLSGKWTYGVEWNVESDKYNPNDLGLLFSNNESSYGVDIEYVEFAPKKNFNRWSVGLSANHQRLYAPNVYTRLQYELRSFFFTKKFHAFGLFTGGQPKDGHDYFEPRTDDFETYSIIPAFQFFGFFISSDYRRTFALDVEYVNGNTFKYAQDYRFYRIAPRWRVNDKILLRFQTRLEKNDGAIGYVNRNGYEGDINGLSEEGILYGLRDRYNWENTFTARWVFSNTAALTFRLRHYQDEVNWKNLGELNDVGWINPIAFDGIDIDGVPLFDRNVNRFNIDMQYTKRFAPGSDFILVWKQQIAGEDQEFERTYFQNLRGLNDLFQTNSISLRIIYFLDYQRFEKIIS